MANDRKFPGQIVTMLYPSRSGLTSRSMPIDEEQLAKIQDALQKAGPGSKLALKPTTPEYKKRRQAELIAEGKRGGPASYIIEVLTAAELNEEKSRLAANDDQSL